MAIPFTSSFNSLCEILRMAYHGGRTESYVLSILCVRFSGLSRRLLPLLSTFNSLCEIRKNLPRVNLCGCTIFQFSVWDSWSSEPFYQPSRSTFNSLCEIPTLFLASFIGLIGDLRFSAGRCAATPWLAEGYLKGSGWFTHQPHCRWGGRGSPCSLLWSSGRRYKRYVVGHGAAHKRGDNIPANRPLQLPP